ncbi:cation transporter [Patescibacteria group bacterium]|nr:cation transporter [Patescibacteria group bacterium]MBU1500055.1 cation transporter [Patescibacteria group bacterium]
MNQTIIFSLSGLHCVNCALNIDNSLEDLPGVLKVQTNYPKSQTKVEFDPQKITPVKLVKTIKSLGYNVLE